MIRLIQRRLIIPRGDTGDFTIPLQPNIETGNAAVFTIFDPMTNKKVWDKLMTVDSQELTIQFTHADTVNLPVGHYVWDIKFYQDPTIIDGKVMDGIEVDSYYAAFKLPVCEIRQTGDALLTADDAPTSTLEPNSLNALMAAVEVTNANKEAAESSASTAEGILDEMRQLLPTIPTQISDLIDDSGHYIKPNEGIPASDLADGVIPATITTDTNPVTQEHNQGEIFIVDGILWRAIENITPAETLHPDVNVEQITLNTILDDKADKTDTVLNTYLSLGRSSSSTKGRYSIAAGSSTIASGNNSIATGFWSRATGLNSHAEGNNTRAYGDHSHAEGQGTNASGMGAHTEGDNTTAQGTFAHAEGSYSHAIGYGSHAEGHNNFARALYSHVEGYENEATNNQAVTHIGGVFSIPTNITGKTITVQGDKHVDGTISSSEGSVTLGKYAEVIGNGDNNSARSNARALDWSGNEYLKGNLYVNANADSSGGVLVATINDIQSVQNEINLLKQQLQQLINN